MRTHPARLLPLIAAITMFPCIAQSTNTLPPDSNHYPREARIAHALQQLQGMNSAQQAQFLQTHPHLRQYLNNHPAVAKGVASVSEAGAGIRDLGHPRVNEVNRREQNLENKINQGVSNGTLTSQQAATLEQKVQNIRQQEAKDMADNNGHLTKTEQHQLNHEENQVNREIKKDKKGSKGK
jgi:thioester reductase-like protein